LLPGGGEIDGVLGADVLAGHDVWIDVDRQRFRIGAPFELDSWFDGVVLPLESIAGRPAMTVDLLDVDARPVRVRLVIDSGTDSVILFGETAARLELARRGTPLSRKAVLSTTLGAQAASTAVIGRAVAGPQSLRLGRATLLPEVRDRVEDGLLPLDRLGPVLLELARQRIVVDARPRVGHRLQPAAWRPRR
jgi:hypothetical protein